MHGSRLIKGHKISVAGQGFAFFAIHQKLDPGNAGNVGGERLYE